MSFNIELNLYKKIIIVFISYTILLCFLAVIVILATTRYSVKTFNRNKIIAESEYYLRNFRPAFNAPTSSSFFFTDSMPPYITYYFGSDSLPKSIKNTVKDFKPGVFFIDANKQKYCILIRQLPGGDTFFFLYNITMHGDDKILLKHLQTNMLLGLLPVLIFGLILGVVTAKKVVNPIVKLSNIMKENDPEEKLNNDTYQMFTRDEIGHLAYVLKQTISQLHESIEYETSFARDASHELRTPISIMKANLELLEKEKIPLSESMHRIIKRLSNATASMEHLVQSFLWLSKHRDIDSLKPELINPKSVIDSVVEEHLYLIKNKKIMIQVDDLHTKDIYAEPNMFAIVIANLLRNACTYTNNGKILISITDEHIRIEDTGMGINPEILKAIRENTLNTGVSDRGFGFGILIVKKLCSCMGWSFHINSNPDHGTEVQIGFLQ